MTLRIVAIGSRSIASTNVVAEGPSGTNSLAFSVAKSISVIALSMALQARFTTCGKHLCSRLMSKMMENNNRMLTEFYEEHRRTECPS